MQYRFDCFFYSWFDKIFNCSWGLIIFNRNNLSPLIASVELPLPDSEEFFQESFDLAFPQVLAWSSAACGILLTVMIIKSFVSR